MSDSRQNACNRPTTTSWPDDSAAYRYCCSLRAARTRILSRRIGKESRVSMEPCCTVPSARPVERGHAAVTCWCSPLCPERVHTENGIMVGRTVKNGTDTDTGEGFRRRLRATAGALSSRESRMGWSQSKRMVMSSDRVFPDLQCRCLVTCAQSPRGLAALFSLRCEIVPASIHAGTQSVFLMASRCKNAVSVLLMALSLPTGSF